MDRLAWTAALAVMTAAAGCATSVPVECPEGFVLAADGMDCGPAEMPGTRDIRDPLEDPNTDVLPDGGLPDAGPACDELDCDDGNECTDDSCSDATCAHAPVEDGNFCDFEGGDGRCQAAQCIDWCTFEDCRTYYPCTEAGIRQAVADGGKTVISCNGPQTVVLTEGELDIYNEVSIDGQGNLTIDAEGRSRIFVANNPAVVELIGINITGGSASTEEENSGGGVYGAGNTQVTVRDCRIHGNTSSTHGGGIRTSGKLTIINTEVTGNTAASRGGGIAVWREATIIDSVVSDNTATNDGGGIYGTYSPSTTGPVPLTIRNSTITGNHANSNGGGVWSSSIVVLDHCTVSGNSTPGAGGGLRTYKGEIRVENGTVVSSNAAQDAAGISSVTGRVFVDRTVFRANRASKNGGAIYASPGSVLEVTNSLFERNIGTDGGGGAVYGSSTVATFRGTAFTGNRARVGGAFRANGPVTGAYDALFENCTLSGNAATDIGGGAIASTDNAAVALVHTTLAGNTTLSEGSGIHQVDGSEVHAAYSVIDNGCFGDADSIFASLGYNAVVSLDQEQCAFTPFEGEASDQTLTTEQIALGTLEFNGGFTPTHLPDAGSSLVDAIPADDCSADSTEDQRGQTRDGSSPCDIGSVEVQPTD